MASIKRIIIEHGFWADPRIERLSFELGCRYQALGMMITAIKLSQNGHIPKCIWEIEALDTLIKVGLARETEAGFEIEKTWY